MFEAINTFFSSRMLQHFSNFSIMYVVLIASYLFLIVAALLAVEIFKLKYDTAERDEYIDALISMCFLHFLTNIAFVVISLPDHWVFLTRFIFFLIPYPFALLILLYYKRFSANS